MVRWSHTNVVWFESAFKWTSTLSEYVCMRIREVKNIQLHKHTTSDSKFPAGTIWLFGKLRKELEISKNIFISHNEFLPAYYERFKTSFTPRKGHRFLTNLEWPTWEHWLDCLGISIPKKTSKNTVVDQTRRPYCSRWLIFSLLRQKLYTIFTPAHYFHESPHIARYSNVDVV